MSTLVGLRHVTRYDYDRPVQLGPHLIRLRPAAHGRARIARYALDVAPAQHVLNWQHDPHGNWLARVVFPEKTKEFSVTVDLVAEREATNPFDFLLEPYAATWPFALPCDVREDVGRRATP
jgi:transglutaminase-like putative cysteine protease